MAARMAVAFALALGLGAPFALALPRAAAAANEWTWDLTPTTLTQGVATDITATISNPGVPIGSMVIRIPTGFSLRTVGITSMPAGLRWTVKPPPSGSPTDVKFSAITPADLYVSGTAVFWFRVTVSAPSPVPSWNATAYATFDGSGKNLGSMTQPKPFTVIVPATATPRPTLSPTPSATPSATPSPGASTPATPTAPPSGSTPFPSTSGAVQPTRPAGTVKPGTTVTPGASASDTPEPTLTPEPTSSEAPPSPSPTPGLEIAPLPAGSNVSIDLNGMSNMALFAWAVPVLFMGLPGLLLVLVVLVQACFAWFFIPVTTRVLGLDNRRKKRRKAAGTRPGA